MCGYIFRALKSIFFFIGIIFLMLIISGYFYTFYKEQLQKETWPSSVKKISISEGEITYQTWGDDTKQAIVLLHGTGANSFVWQETAEKLAQEGYYVIAPDIPPFGWSFIPKTQDYRKEIQAQRIIEMLEKLSIKNPIIVGHSFSSKVATQISLQTTTKKLILIAPVFDYEQQTKTITTELVHISTIRDPLLSLFINNRLLAPALLRSFMYKKDTPIDAVVFYTTQPFNKKGINHAYGEWFQEFFVPKSEISDAESLNKIKGSIYVLWGNRDTISPDTNFEKIKKYSNESVLYTLNDVGHMPHLENNALFISKLLEILR